VTWESIGAIGEVASAFAVLITLIYLARQVGQNSRQQKIESSRATSEEFNRLNSIFYDTEKAGMVARAFDDWTQASVEEQVVAQTFLMRYTQHMQLLFEMHDAAVVSESVYLAERGTLLATLSTPGGATWWKTSQVMYSQPFVESVKLGLESGDHPHFLEVMPWFDATRWPRISLSD
jgi:hypothetical protein